MVDFWQAFGFLLTAVFAGLLGTGGMTLVLFLITRSGLTNARMVFAVGSLFTRSHDSALVVGSVLHITSGLAFGMIYTLAMLAFPAGLNGIELIFVGLGFGFIHGLMVAFFLVAMVADFHPLEEFREAGIAVGMSHLIGHMVYGLLVGAGVAITGIAGPVV